MHKRQTILFHQLTNTKMLGHMDSFTNFFYSFATYHPYKANLTTASSVNHLYWPWCLVLCTHIPSLLLPVSQLTLGLGEVMGCFFVEYFCSPYVELSTLKRMQVP